MSSDRGKLIEIDHKLLEIEAYNMESTFTIEENGGKKKGLTNTKLAFEKCDNLYANKSEYFELNLSTYLCIKPGQNLTAYGLLGDVNNAFKGLRIYINKCSGSDCYNISEINKKLSNSKFIITYLSFSSNMFYLKNENIKYELCTKSCSLSTNILKKIVLIFDKGRFNLYNDIFTRKKISFDFILGNDYSVDMDLDPKSTANENQNTIAYISFHYSGSIIETRKKVQSILDSLSNIGNIFNILLTIFKVINNYYSNKILFVDIFETVFFGKENLNLNIKGNIGSNNILNINKNNINLKNNLDISDEIGFNINSNNIKVKNTSSKKIALSTCNKIKAYKKSQYAGNSIAKNKIMYYYLLPFCILRRNKSFNGIYFIKDSICGYFSIEKINELIKFKNNLENKSLSSKFEMSKTELGNGNNNIFSKNCKNDVNNKSIILKKY